MENKLRLVLEAEREGYAIEQLGRTMTVRDIIDLLEEYDDDTPVYLSHDNGFTFGAIREDRFSEDYAEDEDDEDEDE